MASDKINRRAFAKLASRLRRIKDEQFTMSVLSDCGTPCCIAGHALWMFGKSPECHDTRDAQKLLGLTETERDHLFIPTGFTDGRHPADCLLAAALCDHIAKGGAVPGYDWLVRARKAWDKAA